MSEETQAGAPRSFVARSADLTLNEARETAYRLECLGRDFVVIDHHAEVFFDCRDDSDDGHGVKLRNTTQQGRGCVKMGYALTQ